MEALASQIHYTNESGDLGGLGVADVDLARHSLENCGKTFS
jgi:hypothetical protein